jgi:hypothetical protein
VAHNIVSKGAVTPDQFIWGAAIWKQAMEYKTKTDALMAGLQGKTLAADKKAQLDKAKQLYDRYDYLDAFRLATAAAS